MPYWTNSLRSYPELTLNLEGLIIKATVSLPDAHTPRVPVMSTNMDVSSRPARHTEQSSINEESFKCEAVLHRVTRRIRPSGAGI